MAENITVGACLSDGWSGFQKNAGPAIGVIVIYAVLSGMGGSIPLVNVAYHLVLAPVLSAGLSIFALNVVRGGEGKVDDLFQGFNTFGNFLGAYWLYVAIVVAAFVPVAVGFGIDTAIHGGIRNMVPVVTIAMGAASAIALVIALLRWSMVYYLIIDGMGVIDAFKESARITGGFRGTIFLLALVNVLLMILGFLLLLLGSLVTAPVTMIAFAALYAKLKAAAPSAMPQAPGAPAPPSQGS